MTRQSKIDIEIKTVNGISVVKLANIIDFYNAPLFKAVINKLIAQDKKSVLINLEKINHIDSSGIGALITSMKDLEKIGGSLKICGLDKPVKKIFDMTQAVTLFEIFDSEAEALKKI